MESAGRSFGGIFLHASVVCVRSLPVSKDHLQIRSVKLVKLDLCSAVASKIAHFSNVVDRVKKCNGARSASPASSLCQNRGAAKSTTKENLKNTYLSTFND